MRVFPTSKWIHWGLVATLAGYLALMTYLWTRLSGLWRDEALFLFVTRLPSSGAMLDFLSQHESHPPLFYLLMRGWSAMFGPSEGAASLLPLGFGLATIPAAYWVGTRIFSRRAGMLAALLTAASPALMRATGGIRPYPMLALLCLLALYFFWSAILNGKLRNWIAYGLLMGVMVMTHNWSWVILAGQWMALGLYWVRSPKAHLRPMPPFAASQALILLIALPWLPSFLQQLRHAGHASLQSIDYLATAGAFFSCIAKFPPPFALGLFALLGLYALLAPRLRPTHALPTHAWAFMAPPFLAFLLALLTWSKANLLIAHCYVILVPAMLVSVAAFIERALGPRFLVTAVAAGVLLIPSLLAQFKNLALPKSNARAFATQLAATVRPADLIVVSPLWLASSFNFYFKPNNQQIDFPLQARTGEIPWDRLGERICDPSAMARTLQTFQEARAQGRRVWFVMEKEQEVRIMPRLGFLRDELPSQIPMNDWHARGVFRTGQLMQHLNRLYGPPIRQESLGPDLPHHETLVAFLFTPPAPQP